MEMGHYKIMTDNAENEPVSPSRVEYQQKMSEALASGQVPPDAKILSYRQKAPQASEGKHTHFPSDSVIGCSLVAVEPGSLA